MCVLKDVGCLLFLILESTQIEHFTPNCDEFCMSGRYLKRTDTLYVPKCFKNKSFKKFKMYCMIKKKYLLYELITEPYTNDPLLLRFCDLGITRLIKCHQVNLFDSTRVSRSSVDLSS